MESHGERESAKFANLVPRLLDTVLRLDALGTVALMSTYGLMGAPGGATGVDRKGWVSLLQQGHVEFLQALCLRDAPVRAKLFPDPNSIQDLFDTLPELFGAQQLRRLAPKPPKNDIEVESPNRGIEMVQEYLRAHTAVVRNWGFFGSVTRISRELFSRIDAAYEPAFGMKLSKVVDIFEWLVRRHEDRINEHRQKLHAVFRSPSKGVLLHSFFATFALKGNIDDFRAQLMVANVTLDEVRSALLPWSDRFIVEALFVTNQEIAEQNAVDLDAVRILTNQLSLALGDLSGDDPASFFLDNPVWLRPLVYLEKDLYFSALPQTLMSFIVPIADDLVARVPGLRDKLSDERAKYLEERVFRLFEKALPDCQCFGGFKWKEGPQEFESDLIIRFDTTILLVEAKSGRVSWPALRGAPGRIVEHIRKLIVEPSDQSGRLAERIRDDIARVEHGAPSQLGFPLALDGITCVVRLSVMLHDFATIQSVPTMLVKAGVISSKYPLAPCITLADLEVLLDVLESPALRLHYLRRRAEFLLSLDVMGDELDVIGLYLDTGMNLRSMQGEKKLLVAAGYSSKIDRYYTMLDEGLTARKPKPSTSAWFVALSQQLMGRGRAGWSEIACALLSISPGDQRKLEKLVRALARRVSEGKPLKHGHDAIVLVPPEWESQAIAIQVKIRDGRGPYGSDATSIARQAFESAHVERCIVVVVDASSPELAYLSVGMVSASERDAGLARFF